MKGQIIKQPNGKYCVFSSVVDDFIYVNATKQEIIKGMVEDYTKEVTDKVNKVCKQLEKNEKPYYQFTMSFKDSIKLITKQHGKNCESLKYFNKET